MSHETPEMNEIEAALAAWTPRAPQIDRDRLMFAAGRAAIESDFLAPTPALPLGRRKFGSYPPRVNEGADRSSSARNFWPLATGLSTAATLFLAFQLAIRPPAAPVEQIASDSPTEAKPIQVADSSQPNAQAIDRQFPLPNLADGTYLALRNRMLTTPADQWRFYRTLEDDARPGRAAVEDDDSAVEDDVARRPPTSRNLLRELLPPQSGRTPRESDDVPAVQTTAPHEALT